MLYEKNKEKSLSRELFVNPTAEYRGAPFWSWNTALDKDETLRQAKIFREMGFGGYHIHVRTGLDTPYLGEEFNECVKACVEEGKKEGSLVWLYDEDRWPSGYGGGYVTKNTAYSQRFLYFTTIKQEEKPTFDEKGRLTSGCKLLARYKVNSFLGKIIGYRRLPDGDNPAGLIWYAYLRITPTTERFNNTSYVDAMNTEAISAFADFTYGAYQKTVGGEFGKTIPAMFTDEPEIFRHPGRKSSILPLSAKKPWTDDFDESYTKAYGESILEKLPELFWETANGYSVARYRYYDHLSERFALAFSDNLGRRCKALGLSLTGHLMEEPTLSSQTISSGEAMRQYRGFQIPGIDMLCSYYEFTTAKQAQSAVHQYGREAMLSELYGVSRWDYDFRGYKVHGDWQAALGVSIRVLHLSLMSMKGNAKRDYPASIFYQSPWYKKYGILEDHFARVNTAMTRGTPVVDIAVIHPIESFWLKNGSLDFTDKARKRMNKDFLSLTDWLVRGGLDFDFICESTLPTLCDKGGFPLNVGKMKYKTILVPNCITLRKTTLDRLEGFIKEGGKVIFTGTTPTLEDAKPTPRPSEIVKKSELVPFNKQAIFGALEGSKLVGFYYSDGSHTDNIVYSLRADDDGLWLFAARANHTPRVDENKIIEQKITVKVFGERRVELWDTMSGEVYPIPSSYENGFTLVPYTLFNHDSLLLRFTAKREGELASPEENIFKTASLVKDNVPFSLSEPNVLLLDRAYFALDDKAYSKTKSEILRFEGRLRKSLGLSSGNWNAGQPWASEKKEATHTVHRKIIIYSEIDVKAPLLALEDAETTKITWNGVAVKSEINGWYTDKEIKTVTLPKLKKGKNILELSIPFGENTNLEWCYLLGNFGVRLEGTNGIIINMPKRLTFSDLTKQGLPFYGGEVIYHTAFEGNGKTVKLSVPHFASAILEGRACGEECNIAFSPYTATLPSNDGETSLDITAYISRHNAFGPVHNLDARTALTSPSSYYQPKFLTTNRYLISPTGILSVPAIYRS